VENVRYEIYVALIEDYPFG